MSSTTAYSFCGCMPFFDTEVPLTEKCEAGKLLRVVCEQEKMYDV